MRGRALSGWTGASRGPRLHNRLMSVVLPRARFQGPLGGVAASRNHPAELGTPRPGQDSQLLHLLGCQIKRHRLVAPVRFHAQADCHL